jgi:hypothetical protein
MIEHDPLNYHPLANDRTTAVAPADLLRFIAAYGHVPRIIDLAGFECAAAADAADRKARAHYAHAPASDSAWRIARSAAALWRAGGYP